LHPRQIRAAEKAWLGQGDPPSHKPDQGNAVTFEARWLLAEPIDRGYYHQHRQRQAVVVNQGAVRARFRVEVDQDKWHPGNQNR